MGHDGPRDVVCPGIIAGTVAVAGVATASTGEGKGTRPSARTLFWGPIPFVSVISMGEIPGYGIPKVPRPGRLAAVWGTIPIRKHEIEGSSPASDIPLGPPGVGFPVCIGAVEPRAGGI